MSDALTPSAATHDSTAEPASAKDLASPEVYETLLRLRKSIDNVDAAVIAMLAERFEFTKQVGQLKAQYSLPPSDPQREREQTARLRQLAIDAQLDPEFAEKFLGFVVAEVINHHKRLQQGEATA